MDDRDGWFVFEDIAYIDVWIALPFTLSVSTTEQAVIDLIMFATPGAFSTVEMGEVPGGGTSAARGSAAAPPVAANSNVRHNSAARGPRIDERLVEMDMAWPIKDCLAGLEAGGQFSIRHRLRVDHAQPTYLAAYLPTRNGQWSRCAGLLHGRTVRPA